MRIDVSFEPLYFGNLYFDIPNMEFTPEFIPGCCSPDSQQGNVSSLALEFTLGVCLLACLPGVGGYSDFEFVLYKFYEFLRTNL